ncbi:MULTISPECIES: SpoIIE family protein phosphatase [unclassified Coleofasciculus]|uniref:SpoIIE family protein phosphatase n=1 Tax=unclassified Coleofasciculus TaxID=2692782 RepID=UPI001880A820|nr:MULTISPECIES: SpoIIE family protein phosphatase [unclassified Coleofasciculus]MBE9129656.1 SpoIIE family protein phosphatase [Coleofasciculus sp. LEGE 07081]MBE9152179.1 SpoIIE family protein phosphatase [Coleofasciculus sp. LEGE 07092]
MRQLNNWRLKRSSPKVRALPYLAASLTVASLLAITWVLERAEYQRFQEQTRSDVLNQLSTVRARLEGALNQRLFLTRGLLAYVSTLNPDITQEEFERLSRVLVAQQQGIEFLALYKDKVVSHIYPFKGNEKAIGFNPMTIPEEREAFQRAIQTRTTVFAGPLKLVPKGNAGFISRTPIFRTPPGQAPQSGSNWGLVGIGFDRDTLFEEAGLLQNSGKLEYSIRGKDGLGAAGDVFFGDASIFQRDPILLEVTLPNGSWQLAAVPTEGWPTHAPISRWLWTGSTLLTLLAGVLVFLLVSAPTRLQAAVERATAALRKSEEALKQANEALEMRVEERTAQLAQANQEITTLNDRLKAENVRLSAELEVTRQLQQMILPKEEELRQIPGLDIAGFMEPATEVGGDYYDVLQYNGHVKIGIGDVTGHGLESGVLMLMVQTAVRTLLEGNETDAKHFLDILNRTIYHNVQRMNSDKTLTLTLLDYQPNKLRLSGQHEEVILMRNGGGIERIDTLDLGFPIGLEADITDFVAYTDVPLYRGDVVVLYTDGITEAEDIHNVQYGIERLCDVICSNCQGSAHEIRQTVLADLWQHIGEQKIYDDITLLILKQK